MPYEEPTPPRLAEYIASMTHLTENDAVVRLEVRMTSADDDPALEGVRDREFQNVVDLLATLEFFGEPALISARKEWRQTQVVTPDSGEDDSPSDVSFPDVSLPDVSL